MVSGARHQLHADVLEVIAEYACGTVADACALRGSCKGYRRAVDTTVRRLVYEDQPELRLSLPPRGEGSQPATLHVHLYTEHLDAVRIALTCDAFPRIARLVVVAFALDGAKDEAHEGGACGPRPVAGSDYVSTSRRIEFLQTCNAASMWAKPLQLRASQKNKPQPEAALVRCLTDAAVFEDELTDELDTAVESASRPWAGVRSFVLLPTLGAAQHRHDLSLIKSTRLLRDIGPQLTHLALGVFDRAWCAILATCGNLVEVQIQVQKPSQETTAGICDALIASGAKLERFSFPWADPEITSGLLEAVPTIVAATVYALTVDALPLAVARRLQHFDRTTCHERLPCLRYVDQSSVTWMASEVATVVVARTRLPVADLATAFPQLRELHVPGIAPDVDPDDIAFPRTVEEVTMRTKRRSDPSAVAATTAAVVSALARHGPAHLCNLEDVALPLFAHRCRDLAPLGCFASTLRGLTLEPHNEGAWSPEDIASIEALLAQLVSLERVDVRALPTARCFLGGKHTRLRSLSLGGLGVPFDGLVKACPRLSDFRLEAAPVDAGTRNACDVRSGWTSMRCMLDLIMQRHSRSS